MLKPLTETADSHTCSLCGADTLGATALADFCPSLKGGFGFHPLVCFLANTGEAVSGRLRPGNSAANTTADHVAVLDDALAQIPDAHRHGTEILVRADSAGPAKAFLARIRTLREHGLDLRFSV
jgi:hypothetical protein